MVDMYLERQYASQREIIEKAGKGDAEAEKLLTGLAAEAIRKLFCCAWHCLSLKFCSGLDPPFAGVYSECITVMIL